MTTGFRTRPVCTSSGDTTLRRLDCVTQGLENPGTEGGVGEEKHSPDAGGRERWGPGQIGVLGVRSGSDARLTADSLPGHQEIGARDSGWVDTVPTS